MQWLVAACEDPLVEDDLRHLDSRQRHRGCKRCVAACTCRRFDLEQGPVVRGLIAHLAPRESMLLVCTNHLVCDGVSLQLLFQRLWRPTAMSPSQPATASYPEFARLQRRQLDDGDLRDDLDYWRSKLAEPSRCARRCGAQTRTIRFGSTQ